MTCNGCRTEVESNLGKVGSVVKADVNLERNEAVIEMTKHIPTIQLQNNLPSKYTISEKTKKAAIVSSSDNTTSYVEQLFPLFLIFLYLIVAAILLNYKSGTSAGFMLDFMGLFYIVFSFFKFLDLKGFQSTFKMYDPLAQKLPIYAWAYPFIELGLGLLFLTRTQISFALITTILVLGLTTLGVTKALLDKKSIQCACLGTVLKLPMTKATFIENTIMLVMAILLLFRSI